MTIMQDTAAHEVACQELSHLQYAATCQRLVGGHQGHLVRDDMRIGSNLALYLLLLLCKGGACEQTYQYCCSYNAHDTKGIGTGISIGYGRSAASKDVRACLGGSTQTGGICYGTAEHTHHHGQVAAVLASHAIAIVEHKEEQAYAAEYIQQYYAYCQQVHGYTALLETLKEARTNLQTYTVDKQNQAEVLHKSQGGGGTGQTEVSCQNTCKKHKGYSQGNAEELYSAQCQTYTDNTGIKHNNVAYAVSGGEK